MLVLAAIWAAQTWTRDRPSYEDRDRILVWEEDTLRVDRVRFSSGDGSLELVRRTDEDGESYLWGVEGGGGADPDEYPVGNPGHALVAQLSALRVIRELPSTDAAALRSFGLTDPEKRIVVETPGGRRELAVGDTTYGGEARYALDVANDRVYVIPGSLVRPFEIGAEALRERQLHRYLEDEVGRVRIQAAGIDWTMVEDGAGEWRRDGSEGPDPAFSDFLTRVGQLAIAGYGDTPPPEQLRGLVRMDFETADGEVLGFVELLENPMASAPEFFLRSERTRVLARAVTALAERVVQDLEDVLGSE